MYSNHFDMTSNHHESEANNNIFKKELIMFTV